MSNDSSDRQIHLQGAFNFRDLGGYQTSDGRRIRWRRLFRSDELHYLTDYDLTHTRDTLGIRTVIDLRKPRAPAQVKKTALAIPPIQLLNIPVPLTPVQVFRNFLLFSGAQKALFAQLEEAFLV